MRKCSLVLVLLIATMLVAGSMAAQQTPTAKQLVGAWTLVSIYNDQDGKKIDIYGPSPKGITIMSHDGHFARMITRSGLPKFAVNNREKGTPEENKAVMQGSIAYFGTYSCSAADKGCILHVEESTFPNWVGANQKRLMTLVGDELREVNPLASTGTGKGIIVWKRAR